MPYGTEAPKPGLYPRLFLVTKHKRSKTTLIQVVQKTFGQGVSTRKSEKLAHSLEIKNLSRSQASEITKGLKEQMQAFRSSPLAGRYRVIWTDALYEKNRMDAVLSVWL